jgi:hypothetical protein
MAVSVSVQFEAGRQPVSGAGGPITEPILPGFADLGQNSLYEWDWAAWVVGVCAL